MILMQQASTLISYPEAAGTEYLRENGESYETVTWNPNRLICNTKVFTSP